MEFVSTLIGIIAILAIGYCCGVGSACEAPENALQVNSGQTEPGSYFCPKTDICQAIRVSDGYFPDWVLQTGAEVVIAPSPRIVIQQGNTSVKATVADYLLKLSDGTFFAVPVEQFEHFYQAIDPV